MQPPKTQLLKFSRETKIVKITHSAGGGGKGSKGMCSIMNWDEIDEVDGGWVLSSAPKESSNKSL